LTDPLLHIEADGGATARAAARFVAECARLAVAERGACHLAFSGGSSPRAMLGALVAEDIPWRELHIFQVDERAAPHGHGDRNLTQLEETLLGTTPLARDQLHAMPVEDDDLEAAAERYARELGALAGSPAVLDLVHLGLGDDGHTASLVPGDPDLDVDDRDVAVSGDYRGYHRMTLTFPMLDRARQRLWLVTGAGKAQMLARLCAGDTGIPAGRVNSENAVVFTDCKL
jgi:6-phosphogluconolactonase